MKFHYTTLETCREATELVVVIDVIRAFTNAAFAFYKGAKEIYPVSGVVEALEFKAQFPGTLACGEVGGVPPAGFDFGNSPTQTSKLELGGRILVQRTGAGTQGIARSVNAGSLVAASFVVAQASAEYILDLAPASVTFVVTGQTDPGSGDEDLSCAEYLEAILRGGQPDPAPYVERVYNSRDARLHLDPNFPAFPKSDLELCTQIDAFDFAMPVTRKNGRHVMRAVKP